MEIMIPLLHQEWNEPGGFHGGEWGFFHPALLWLGLLLIFAMKRRWGWLTPAAGRSDHGGRAGQAGADAPPDPTDPNAPVWPDLYPNAPERPAPGPGKTELL